MSGYVVMENPSCSHFHDHEHVQSAEGDRDHGEEVARHDRLGVVADERQPSLLRISHSPGPAPLQVFPDGSGRNPNTEFQLQFIGDAFFAPGHILGGHLADQPS